MAQWLKDAEERSGDFFWRHGSHATPERRLLLIDIDDTSVSRIGPWPWPRERVAELVDKLRTAGAQAIALDIVFPDPKSGDEVLSEAIQRSPVVLSQILAIEGSTPSDGQLQGAQPNLECRQSMATASGFIGNSALLKSSAGHITPRIAEDGSVRHLPALICHGGKVYASLVLPLLQKTVEPDDRLILSPGTNWLQPHSSINFAALPGLVVPLDENGDVRVPYRRSRSAFSSISASDILENRFSEQLLKGSLILVGATAFGLADSVPTPHGGAVSGVEVHAQFLSGLLDDAVPYTPRGASALQWLMSGSAAIFLLLLAGVRTGQGRIAIWLPVAGLIVSTLWIGLHGWALLNKSLWIGWVTPAIFTFLSAIALAIAEHARLRFERSRLYENLSAYLPAPVANRIALSEVRGIIEADRREVTVLFADIRNFSAYCEGRPPEEAAAMLHAFFTTASTVVEAHQGVIEEFVGDAIMAVWNAPIPCPDHTVQAYAAAQALQKACAPLFPATPPPGLEPLALGIGLETGQALVGSFGPAQRRTHGALGETVTIAERLTALTGDLAQPVLIGEKAAKALGPSVALRDMGSFLLEGLRRPHQIFSPESPEA
jgi:adenylate cyclase